METTLESQLPCESPYAQAPRTVCDIPANTVDWILLQLRDKTDRNQIVKEKSLFLRNDGLLMDDLGNTQIQLSDIPADDYYISLKHRNHLDVISSSTHALNSSTSVLIDFTQSGIFEGINGEKEFTSGVWGLWAGDINQDGLITTLDYTTWYNAETAGTGYYNDSDIDLDSMINSQDFILWYMNSKQGIISPLYP
jgi:hypothetical protein